MGGVYSPEPVFEGPGGGGGAGPSFDPANSLSADEKKLTLAPGAGEPKGLKSFTSQDRAEQRRRTRAQIRNMTVLPAQLDLTGLGNYANDAAAAAGGVAIGRIYRNGSVLMVRVV